MECTPLVSEPCEGNSGHVVESSSLEVGDQSQDQQGCQTAAPADRAERQSAAPGTRQHPAAAAGQHIQHSKPGKEQSSHNSRLFRGKLDLRFDPPRVPQTIPLTWGKVEGHIPINTV